MIVDPQSRAVQERGRPAFHGKGSEARLRASKDDELQELQLWPSATTRQTLKPLGPRFPPEGFYDLSISKRKAQRAINTRTRPVRPGHDDGVAAKDLQVRLPKVRPKNLAHAHCRRSRLWMYEYATGYSPAGGRRELRRSAVSILPKLSVCERARSQLHACLSVCLSAHAPAQSAHLAIRFIHPSPPASQAKLKLKPPVAVDR